VECSFTAGFADSTGLAPFSKVGHKMPLIEVQQKTPSFCVPKKFVIFTKPETAFSIPLCGGVRL
jgi:hypothetical protein